MAQLQISRNDTGGAVTLRLEGALDALAAASLRTTMDQLAGRQIVLDFTRVDEFQDLAVPILSGGLGQSPLRLIGLGQHHARLFRYFGIGLNAPAAMPFGRAEPALA